MFERHIDFGDAGGLLVRTAKITETGFHVHSGILEIVCVLSGRVDARVSMETFELEAGDYIVINHGDPHFLGSAKDNVTASLYVDLDVFRDISPYLMNFIFTCESFDLPRYKHQETYLRTLIADILAIFMTNGANRQSSLRHAAYGLLKVLCAEYTVEYYYNRNVRHPADRIEKYFRVIRYLSEYYMEKNVLDLIAEKEYYSKSYISHLFKEVGFSNFSDNLSFYRVAAAEKLLLATDRRIGDIAVDCGFSDVKYLRRDFAEWFGMSPFEYRKKYWNRVNLPDRVADFPAEQALPLVYGIAAFDESPEPPRYSMTPMSIKIAESKKEIFGGFELKTSRRSGASGVTSPVLHADAGDVRSSVHVVLAGPDPERRSQADRIEQACKAAKKDVEIYESVDEFLRALPAL